MPIVITFDVDDNDTNQRNRVQEFFEKLGWQHLGGTAYRYPKLGQGEIVEGWFNAVIPALFLFREYLTSSDRLRLKKFTLDIQTSTGYDEISGHGNAPVTVFTSNDLNSTKLNKFTIDNLIDWLNKNAYPYK